MSDSLPTETEVDPEIARLKEAYEAFRGMDREAQIRALAWLTDRLEHDEIAAQRARRVS